MEYARFLVYRNMRYTCLCILIFAACTGYVDRSKPLQYDCKDFILIDSVKPVHPRFLTAGKSQDFPICYIGPISDTISIKNRDYNGKSSYAESNLYPVSRSYTSNELEVSADTSVSCFSGIEYWYERDTPFTDSTKWYHSFLLILKNTSDSTLFLGRTFSLYYMQLEGQCQDGQWTRIQKPLSEVWMCLTGEPDIYLRPGEIILSKIIRRKDPDFIQYRLAWKGGGGIIYSNLFTM